MTVWKIPPIIKVYEALGCIADGRVELDGNTAKVFSSSRGKFYTVTYDPEKNAIMANDNGSYWQGYLGYPAIASLLEKGIIPYDRRIAGALAGIAWKDINTKFKNDYAKTSAVVMERAQKRGVPATEVEKEGERILEAIVKLAVVELGSRIKPPTGY